MTREAEIFRNQFLRGKNSRFAPHADLAGKRNFCRHLFVNPEGSVSEVIRLNVLNDRHREDIIGFHFSQQYGKIYYGEQPERPHFYVVGRDKPWDFEYVMHDGTTFSLEVCRVADRDLLKAIKIENDVTTLMMKSELKGFEIQKIEKHFPGALPPDLVAEVRTRADRKRRYTWDFSYKGTRFFWRPPMNPHLDLKAEIRTALEKKAAKKHAGKDRTIIVLDNLTTHSEPDEFFDATEDLADFLDQLPFKSVWLYTGYYSDDNGYNCEYSMVPIKMSDEEAGYLAQYGIK